MRDIAKNFPREYSGTDRYHAEQILELKNAMKILDKYLMLGVEMWKYFVCIILM